MAIAMKRLLLSLSLATIGLQPVAAEEAAEPQGLTPQILYRFLLGEIAQQRGQGGAAVELFDLLTEESADPMLGRRAAQLAIANNRFGDALRLTARWYNNSKSPEAAEWLVALALRSPDPERSRIPLQQVLTDAGSRRDALWRYYAEQLPEAGSPTAVYPLTRDLTEPYKTEAGAWWARANAAAQVNRKDEALDALEQALRLNDNFEDAAVLRAQLRARNELAEASKQLQAYVSSHPKAMRARLMLALSLADLKRGQEALAMLQALRKEAPESAEVAYQLGRQLAGMEQGKAAEGALQDAIRLRYRDTDTVYLLLGRLAAERGDVDAALRAWDAVEGGAFLNAQRQAAELLARKGRLAEARSRVSEAIAQQPAARRDFLSIDAQVLSLAGQHQQAYDVLTEALQGADEESDADLRLQRSFVAEKMNRLDWLEQDLRIILKRQPDNATALNALGYTLTDRTDRHTEALTLISKALEKEPDNPAILDSMGWVKFKLGQLAEATDYLRTAYSKLQEPDVAAHLGEVLWLTGKQAEARALLQDALKKHPDEAVLLDVMKRLQVK